MNISPLVDSPFGDREAFLDFLGANEIAHIAFSSALTRRGHIVSAIPPIGNPMETPDWLNAHWQRHRDECSTLGIAVPDLSVVDLHDEHQYLDWMILHGQLHRQQNEALGITT